MANRLKACALVLVLTMTLPIIGTSQAKKRKGSSETATLQAKIRRFAPTVITADSSRLSQSDQNSLMKIIAAAKLMDPLYLRQVWSGNEVLLKKLEADNSILGRIRLHYFLINDGPWSQLDDNLAFIEGVPHEKLPQANYYPEDVTKDEFNSWVATLNSERRQKATGFFYTIRRDKSGKLTSVPYSEEYREFLGPAASLLREAAEQTTNASLKDYLRKRADAFISNDYYDSDVAWMDLDAPIDVTIGPYETYSDGLFGYKAAFEAYVTLRDDVETAKLTRFSGLLQELENNLPIEPEYRNPKLGAASPIRVVNVVFTSGEGNTGVQTAAFNLPNDERVVTEKGSKRVMLRNVQQAKFDKTLIPISRVVLDAEQQRDVSFDAFFTHTLAHELMHGLGPQNIRVHGEQVTVRQQLKETYSAIEEAKADITGLWALQYLMERGAVDKKIGRSIYTTFLASAFRSVRFGLTEAHGKAVALQFNYLSDEGAIIFDQGKGVFRIVPSKIKDAVSKLTHDILTLQAEGSYERAKAMLETYGVMRPEMQSALDRLKAVPVDIEPSYPLATQSKRKRARSKEGMNE